MNGKMDGCKSELNKQAPVNRFYGLIFQLLSGDTFPELYHELDNQFIPGMCTWYIGFTPTYQDARKFSSKYFELLPVHYEK